MIMPRVTKREFKRIAIVSLLAGLIIIIYPFIAKYLHISIILTQDTYTILGIIVIVFPTGIAHLLNVMWRRGIDRNIPKLLRQVAEAGRVGVSIPKALAIASRYDLGPLTPELRKAVTKLSWGYPLEKVINDLIEELGTPTSRRAFKLILEASKSGGDVEEMLMVLQRHISGIQLTLRERRMMMRPYISYGYIAFFVFLAIEVILLKSFFLPILSMRAIVSGMQSMFKISITSEQIRTYFYHISLLEALISGLVSGKMGEGTIFAGLKHVAILLISTILTFHLLIF